MPSARPLFALLSFLAAGRNND
ncbi:protein of unknown function [Methylocella tundrae]|uniref:Uncharacterized protein n=1 Tax=Methylocella tundrae TaxID=227605 RepID=A0A4U8Z3Z8_METTU|nr:protein of unknown function [Methylocella tundrae]